MRKRLGNIGFRLDKIKNRTTIPFILFIFKRSIGVCNIKMVQIAMASLIFWCGLCGVCYACYQDYIGNWHCRGACGEQPFEYLIGTRCDANVYSAVGTYWIGYAGC
ncbi:MAG: hypothetical protein Q8M34_02670, partial [Thermodesulfovibrionales bacterium]|nr:hypothetical protein [Thermodesulfovibrionales bacterium]